MTAAATPTVTPLGVILPGEETASVGPNVGEGTASPAAHSFSGHAALAGELSNPTSLTSLAFALAGMFGGPFAGIIAPTLKAMMTKSEFGKTAKDFTALTPAQRAQMTLEEAFTLSKGLQIADPMGQKQTAAFQAQRRGEQEASPTPQAPTQDLDIEFGMFSGNPPGGAPTGEAPGNPGGAGVGGGAGTAGAGPGDPGGPFHRGGPIPRDRRPGLQDRLVRAQEGEYVVRAPMAAKHRRLLEAINRDDRAAMRRAVR